MPTKFFTEICLCLDYVGAIVDAGLDDIQELRFWRSKDRYCVHCEPVSAALDLPERSLEDLEQGIEGAGGSSSGPITIQSGGTDEATPGPKEPSIHPPTALGFQTGDVLDIQVVLRDQDFGRDQASAKVERDQTGFLNPIITLELSDLPDVEWSRLVAAGRNQDCVVLRVLLLASRTGRPAKSRVRVEKIVSVTPVGQGSLVLP